MTAIEKKPLTQRFQKMALVGYVGLLILMPLWLFVLSPRAGHSLGFMFTVYILPLPLPLRGFIKYNP